MLQFGSGDKLLETYCSLLTSRLLMIVVSQLFLRSFTFLHWLTVQVVTSNNACRLLSFWICYQTIANDLVKAAYLSL